MIRAWWHRLRVHDVGRGGGVKRRGSTNADYWCETCQRWWPR